MESEEKLSLDFQHNHIQLIGIQQMNEISRKTTTPPLNLINKIPPALKVNPFIALTEEEEEALQDFEPTEDDRKKRDRFLGLLAPKPEKQPVLDQDKQEEVAKFFTSFDEALEVYHYFIFSFVSILSCEQLTPILVRLLDLLSYDISLSHQHTIARAFLEVDHEYPQCIEHLFEDPLYCFLFARLLDNEETSCVLMAFQVIGNHLSCFNPFDLIETIQNKILCRKGNSREISETAVALLIPLLDNPGIYQILLNNGIWEQISKMMNSTVCEVQCLALPLLSRFLEQIPSTEMIQRLVDNRIIQQISNILETDSLDILAEAVSLLDNLAQVLTYSQLEEYLDLSLLEELSESTNAVISLHSASLLSHYAH